MALFFSSLSYSNAQDIQTTPNLIQPNGWQGCLDQHPGWIWGGTRGGPCPVQRSGDGAILFSYGVTTLNQSIAINQALSGTGIQVRGYDYSWNIKNANAGAAGQSHEADPLQITVALTNTNGNALESKTYDYSYRIFDWTTYSGSQTFENRYSLSEVDRLNIAIRGSDKGYWAGYYGPEIRNIDVRLRYSLDPCALNPLSSPTCSGFAEAFKLQQCTANPLFDSSCPGYAQAYFTQQCTANPLYNAGCPGYAQAYFNQQCSINVFYNPQCPGYQQAYQQKIQEDACKANPQSNPQCAGFTPIVVVTQSTQPEVVIQQDPVAAVTEVPVTPDVVVNQVIAPPKPLPKEVNETKEQSLGTGIIIPGLRITLPDSRRQNRQTENSNQAVRQPLPITRETQVRRTDPQSQQQAQVIAEIGNVPGFETYLNALLPDAQFYPPRDIYRGNVINDNARAQRALSQRSDRLHKEMIDEQYRR